MKTVELAMTVGRLSHEDDLFTEDIAENLLPGLLTEKEGFAGADEF